MIKLTNKFGASHWINPDHVTDINHDERGACIYRTNDVSGDYPPLVVTESPEEVVRKIMEYKLAMVRYSSAYAEAVKHEDADAELAMDMNHDDMKRLAGLEESPDA